MTKRKSDGGPERRDGEAQGVSSRPTPGTLAWMERYPPDAEKWARVWDIITGPTSGSEPVALPPWARQPMIDSGPVKPRIVHAWHDPAGYLWVLGSDGRMFLRWTDGNWHAPESYPQGLEP